MYVESSGLDEITEKLENLSKNKVQEVKDDIVQIIMQAEEIRFRNAPGVSITGMTEDGVTWNALSDNYLKSRPDRLGGQQLIDSKELMYSVSTPGYNNQQIDISGNQITFRITLDYAEKANKERKFLYLSSNTIRQIVDYIIQTYQV
jgi:hypothetical protein